MAAHIVAQEPFWRSGFHSWFRYQSSTSHKVGVQRIFTLVSESNNLSCNLGWVPLPHWASSSVQGKCWIRSSLVSFPVLNVFDPFNSEVCQGIKEQLPRNYLSILRNCAYSFQQIKFLSGITQQSSWHPVDLSLCNLLMWLISFHRISSAKGKYCG